MDETTAKLEKERNGQVVIPASLPSMRDAIRAILYHLGEDPDREGLRETPKRVEESLRFLTEGYRKDINRTVNGALYSVCYDEMVIVKDIELFSMCEHHMLPFFGKAHIAYIPNKKVIGLSKVARVVDVFARRLQIQERLTSQIARAIEEKIQPQGVAVIVEAQHLCMMMRGVEKQHSRAVTSAMLGVFQTPRTRNEFLSLVQANSKTI